MVVVSNKGVDTRDGDDVPFQARIHSAFGGAEITKTGYSNGLVPFLHSTSAVSSLAHRELQSLNHRPGETLKVISIGS